MFTFEWAAERPKYHCLKTSADTCMYATTLTMTACDFILKVTMLLLESPNYFD